MISIRPASEGDLPEILSIYNDIILHTTAVYDYKPHTLEMRKSWYASKLKDNYPVFVAVEDDKIVGFSSIGPFRAWAAYKYSVENSVYVAAEQRGRGIGKILLPPLITAANERNLHVILAGIDASNDASIHLHMHFGFQEVAHFKEVGYKFGRWLDLKFLELTLKTPSVPQESE
jgi:phosphinothricin acetyltransferase